MESYPNEQDAQSADATSPEVETLDIPYLHKKIKLSDLNAEHKLLSLQEAKEMITPVSDTKTGLVHYDEKRDLGIVKAKNKEGKDRIYAIYGYADPRGDKRLGAGVFGTVHVMQDLESGDVFAVKVQVTRKKVKENKDNEPSSIDAENAALASLGELEFKSVQTSKINNGYFDELHLSAMSLASGAELQTGIIEPRRRFPPVRWFDMVVSGLEDLQRIHRAGLIHRDIKGANIIFDPITHKLKIIDLGLSAGMQNGAHIDVLVGTPLYMPPEIWGKRNSRKKHLYNEKTDVYAMGVTLKEMFGFPREASLQIPDPVLCNAVSKFLKRMTHPHPDQRPGLKEAKKFFENLRDLELRAPALVNRVASIDISEHKALFTDEFVALTEKLVLKKSEMEELKQRLYELNEFIISRIDESGSMKAREEIRKIKTDLEICKTEIVTLENRIKEQVPESILLKKTDEVWLVAPKDMDMKSNKLLMAKRAFENLGIIVNDKAILYDTKEDIPKVTRAYADQREKNDGNNNIYLHAHLQNGKLIYPAQMTDAHFAKILQELRKDEARLFKKNKGPEDKNLKLKAVRDCIASLEKLKKEEKTYEGIDNVFKQLQDQLYENKKVRGAFETVIGVFGSTTRQRVVKLRKETKQIAEMTKLREKNKAQDKGDKEGEGEGEPPPKRHL